MADTFAEISDLSSSTGLSGIDGIEEANLVTVQAQGGAVRYRPDGSTTAPTWTSGMLLTQNDTIQFRRGQSELSDYRFIQDSGDTSKLGVILHKFSE